MLLSSFVRGKKRGGEGKRDGQRNKTPVCVLVLAQPQGVPSVCESVHLEVLKFWSLPELLSDIFLCVLDLWHWQSASSLSTAPQSKLRYQQPCSNGEFWPKQGCPASWGFPPPTISSAVSLLSWQWFYLATVWDNARHTTDKGFFVGLLLSVTQVASHCADSGTERMRMWEWLGKNLCVRREVWTAFVCDVVIKFAKKHWNVHLFSLMAFVIIMLFFKHFLPVFFLIYVRSGYNLLLYIVLPPHCTSKACLLHSHVLVRAFLIGFTVVLNLLHPQNIFYLSL